MTFQYRGLKKSMICIADIGTESVLFNHCNGGEGSSYPSRPWCVDELCIALLLQFLIKHAIIIMLKGRGSGMKGRKREWERKGEGLVGKEDSKFMSACAAETPGQPTHQAFPVAISRWTSISCVLHFLAFSLCSCQWIFGFHRHCLRTEAA